MALCGCRSGKTLKPDSTLNAEMLRNNIIVTSQKPNDQLYCCVAYRVIAKRLLRS